MCVCVCMCVCVSSRALHEKTTTAVAENKCPVSQEMSGREPNSQPNTKTKLALTTATKSDYAINTSVL